jgi:ribosomal protein S18 acetylase RimI-like enzyme
VATLTPAEIRPLAQEEIAVVVRAVPGLPGRHEERLARQHRGGALYLFAWIDDEPVGRVFLVWSSALGIGTAHLENLHVDESCRRRGIGTLLVERCEREAMARGFDRIEFGVGIDNDAARRFYVERGYAELEGQVPHLVRWPQLEASGAMGEGHEWCTTFTKHLGRPAD